ncbi:SRP40, C-terminal domain [Musa troglodytarum]|uniref:SRP40, C-terminal domain n=1 Tax=Musa troglodytarum TaxID=320322 RepID=A0A9E7GTA9_9LILI|nr:SRP40, C-terminal domain [Musa troglodytarum]
MLGSSLPNKRANPSSSIPFVPRQIMLVANSAVAAVEDSKARRKEKKERKKRSSETLHLDGTEVVEAPRNGLGRDVLLRSIAAFLDGCGFSRTLSVFQSEAQMGCWKSSSFNLEDLFCKFLDSRHFAICSNGHGEASIDWPRDQDLQKVNIPGVVEGKNMNCTTENIHKKKRKRTDQINDGTESEKLKMDEDLHAKTKEKKKTKKLVHDPATEGCENKHLEVSREKAESIDPANQSPDPHKNDKEKKKKLKSTPETHDVIAEPSDFANVKHKSEKKKEKKLKKVEVEASENISDKRSKDMKLEDTEGPSGPASENLLNHNDSQCKVKKKKQKLTSDVVSTVKSNQAAEEKSGDQIKECKTSDFGYESLPISEGMNVKVAKKPSKKRKVLPTGGITDNETADKDSKVKSEGAENIEETENLVKCDKSALDSDTPVTTKKRKMEESKDSNRNAGKQLELSTQANENNSASKLENEVVGNGSIGSNRKKEDHSAEPKSVNAFQRVKIEEIKFVDERLKDNSYWAKHGADTGYGAKAQEVLGQVRGRDFRHEKTKKKRGSYRGGQIDLQSHSIKFSYSEDDE